MGNHQLLQELSARLACLIPAAEELGADARSKMELTIKQALQGLNVLTVEEFETWQRALQRAETRVAELEILVKQLEARLAERQPTA